MFLISNFNDTVSVQKDIAKYIESLPEGKQADMEMLHQKILHWLPKCRLWFLDGKDDQGKIVSNPNIGYGVQIMQYAGGKTKEFYQVGISANTGGISVYIMGIKDKKYLQEIYGKKLGKAVVTGYCIKFRSLSDIDTKVLEAAVIDGVSKSEHDNAH